MVAHLWAVAFLCVKRNPGPGCGPISENLSSGSCEGGPKQAFWIWNGPESGLRGREFLRFRKSVGLEKIKKA